MDLAVVADGPLEQASLISHVLRRLDLDARLDRFVPTSDRRVRVAYGQALGVLLRSILEDASLSFRQCRIRVFVELS